MPQFDLTICIFFYILDLIWPRPHVVYGGIALVRQVGNLLMWSEGVCTTTLVGMGTSWDIMNAIQVRSCYL